MTFAEYLASIEACPEALDWVGGKTLDEAWSTCDHADWMIWLAGRANVDPRLIVTCACDCARAVLHLVPDDEDRPRLAVEAAEAWCRADDDDAARAARAAHAAAARAAAYATFVTNAAVRAAAASAVRAAHAAAFAATFATNAAANATHTATHAAYDASAADPGAALADLIRLRIPVDLITTSIRGDTQ